jgi:hypothetical protein
MQTKLNLVFLLGIFSLNTLLCADDIRLENTFERLKKVFPTIQCNQQKLLSRYEGHYVTKGYWIGLEKTKSHPLSGDKESYTIDIGSNGFVLASPNWHEGAQPYECTFEKENILWLCNDGGCSKLKIDHQKQLFISVDYYDAKDIVSLSTKEIPMDGPFIRIGKSRDDSAYFEKIFQHKCYTSDVSEKWCFGKDEITVDNQVHKVYLELDIVLMPQYGNILTFDDKLSDNLFVFVPYENGWKIFQDTSIDRENYIPVNPLTDKPWRILRE